MAMGRDVQSLDVMSDEGRELALYLENTWEVYRAYYLPSALNLQRKWVKGTFSLDLGIKGMRHAVDRAAKRYTLEHGSMSDKWSRLFSVKDRDDVAEYLVRFLVDEWRVGNMLERAS